MSLVRFVAALGIACAGAPAVAATPHALAFVDLASFSYIVEDMSLDDGFDAAFSMGEPFFFATACIGPGEAAICQQPGTPYVGQYGIVDPITLTHTVPGATGTATIAPSGLWSELSATGGTGPKGVNASYSGGGMGTGSGRVTFSVDYRIEAGGLDGLSWRETLAWTGIILFPGVGLQQVEALAVAPDVGSGVKSGRLSISYDFTDGQSLGVFMQAHTHQIGLAAPVPEPTTWAMLLAGVAAIGVRRTRSHTPDARQDGMRSAEGH